MNTNAATDQHRASEPSVAEMASMIDFGDGLSQTTDQHDDENNNFIDVEAIEEENSFLNDEFNPEKNITKVGFRKNAAAKLALVSMAGLIAIVGGTSFFQGQMPKEKVAEAPKVKDSVSEQVEAAQSDTTKAQQSESETKSELALSKQKDALEQANSNKTNDPTTGKPSDKATTDTSIKVATSPAPSVSIVPALKPSRASGFVASPVAPPLAISPNGSTRIASAPFATPASNKNNISIPPAGVRPLPVVSTPKLATTPIGSLISKNNSPAPAGLALPIAMAPGVPKTPKTSAAEPSSSKNSIKEIAKIEPTRSSYTNESPSAKKRLSEENEEVLPRLRIARAPGLPVDNEVASNILPPPLYPGTNSLAPQPIGTPSTVLPTAISSAPSLTDFLKTSAAADIPPAPQPQLIALNKEQSKDKQPVTIKEPKTVLQTVAAPSTPTTISLSLTPSATTKNSPVASKNKNNSYSGLVSPNSPLTDIADPAPFGITNLVATADTTIQPTVKTTLAQAVPPGISSARPAYAHTKMLLAGIPDANMNLGNVESATTTQQNSQVSKSQVVSQNNPVLNQPTTTISEQKSTTITVPGTPISPVSPTAPVVPQAIGPIAASILTGTSAKGTTLTPILWGAESATGAKFVAKLEEPLLANNKREALPAGTQLIVVAKPGNNNSGLAEVEVISVIVQGKEYATPPGAIVIHDENNGLLVGEDYFKREEQIAGRDYMTILGGALGTLGQVFNRPSGSFSSNTSGFGSSSTNVINNRDPNVFGALLEGGFKDIPGIWNQRNQQALAQLANQPKVYQIPKGRTIRVFVNQSIIF
jgi:Bacterial conjugation TrbI-like protein